MSAEAETHQDYGFVFGLAAGMVVGAGLAIWLAPRAASELRQRVTESAVNGVTEAGQDARNGLADAVVLGAQAVERHATATKTSRAPSASSDEPAARTATAPDVL